MIWIVDEAKSESYQIVGTNIHQTEKGCELWATRSNGKTIKLIANEDCNEVSEFKEAIDYAIANGAQAFKL